MSFKDFDDQYGVSHDANATADESELSSNPPGLLEDENSDLRLAIRDTHVLLVEDNSDNSRFMSRFITMFGGKVDFAVNGLEGVKKALHGNYDVVLMDLYMPVMDGYEATRKLRGYGYEGSIIAVTAHSTAADRERCLEIGFDEYLTKPVNRMRLMYAIASRPRRSHEQIRQVH